VARLDGITLRHARWHKPSEAETAVAVAELREAAGDRSDLLAEVAGLLLGFHEGGLDEARAKAAASFCLAASADAGQVERWTQEGRRRAEAARLPPFSGGVRPLGAPAGDLSTAWAATPTNRRSQARLGRRSR
jgi:hypothetical protein